MVLPRFISVRRLGSAPGKRKKKAPFYQLKNIDVMIF